MRAKERAAGTAARAPTAAQRPGDGRAGIDPQQAELLRLARRRRDPARARSRAGQRPGRLDALGRVRAPLADRLAAHPRRRAQRSRGRGRRQGRLHATARPSRRAHLNRKVILPTLQRPLPDVAIVCDTSGSMHELLLARALAEIEALLARAGLRQAQVRVLAVDTAVHTARRVTRATQVQLAGGGGTDMGAGIHAAAGLRPRPSVVIVLTDGFTPWPEQPPARDPRDRRPAHRQWRSAGLGAPGLGPRCGDRGGSRSRRVKCAPGASARGRAPAIRRPCRMRCSRPAAPALCPRRPWSAAPILRA